MSLIMNDVVVSGRGGSEEQGGEGGREVRKSGSEEKGGEGGEEGW